ncbi:outer membrane protein assembly factor BamB [Luteibacter yeojuensis]|uniref:Outer membrane protein assembly factor BamB n=1 Tax=Luteibacter yeojuensis TaxID=345309 RepID=A0A0F3KAU4_9GAMM|nr:outer membrane protein assembly factor BamB [Luteibacter yeojuensis]KJV28097.1 membrane protein [Luteibacter yeojuensis]
MKRFWAIALTSSLAAVAGCHSFKKENVEPPTPLDKKFEPSIKVERLWKNSVGDGSAESGIRMRPAVVDNVVYAASTDGKLAAFDAASGKTLWSKSIRQHGWFGWGDAKREDARFSGGPGVTGDLLAVGTLDGHVYAMNAKDGERRWAAEVSSEVVTAPVIVGDLVVVRCNDGRIYGLDAKSGERRWVYDQSQVPLLSLRGNGRLLVANGVVFSGSDAGKLVAIRLDNGEKLWEQTLASGEGRTEIDRLNDADGAISLDGTTLYGGAYHGQIAAFDGPSGRPLWNHNFSTFTSLDVHGNGVYGADDTSQVFAFDKASGANIWKQDALKWRWVTGPAAQGDYLVVGDLDGHIHWLNSADGKIVARERLSKKAIRAQPVVSGDTVYVEDVEGHVGAYRVAH